MLYESAHVRVSAADGVATLWLEFPGSPVNALSPMRMIEIGATLVAVERNPHVEILVVRSGKPAGFCGGAMPIEGERDPASYASIGQRVTNALANLGPMTVAFLEGPCLGPGLELALACDYRLAVAGPDSWIGFNGTECWGGPTRLRRLIGRKAEPLLSGRELLTAKEARRHGILDDAFSARRSKVELRLFLDRLLQYPRKRSADSLTEGMANERRTANPVNAGYAIPSGNPHVESAIRGQAVTLTPGERVDFESALALAIFRGRVTPLEADLARSRIQLSSTKVARIHSEPLLASVT